MEHGYRHHLEVAIAAARRAGALLCAELARPGGPRGQGDHAPVDAEAEALIRDALESAFPTYGVRGEELGERDRESQDAAQHGWLLDPNDGTRAFLEGFRGAAVSIALLRGGVPVLGVVYAYAAPDDGGDLIAWAEGQPLTRNGRVVNRAPLPEVLGVEHTVMVSQHADRASRVNAELVWPARFRATPSVAYRLALVAAGEGELAVSLGRPMDWDVAAGHGLLRAVGGELVTFDGEAVRYRESRVGDVVGGALAACRAAVSRPWASVLGAAQEDARESALGELVWPAPGVHVADVGLLSRAQGALLGQLAGDALGALVEFRSRADIARDYPRGVRELRDGGTWDTLAGQPTDDSELALALARTLVRVGAYAHEDVARAYAGWLASGPFDCGATIGRALQAAVRAVAEGGSASEAAMAAANPQSQANGALMRISPLGIWGHALTDAALCELARTDARLTHPHPFCADASAAFTIAIAFAIRTGAQAAEVARYAHDAASRLGLCPEVLQVLEAARSAPPADYVSSMGWVRIALHNAFYQLQHAPSLEEGLVATIAGGGDTDTNAAIAGALLGAVHGREALPQQWRDRVTSCRPIAGVSGVRRPTPRGLWPVDALLLAEALLVCGSSAR